MKTKSSFYTLLLFFLIILFISRPDERRHRDTLVDHLSLRHPEENENYTQFMIQELRYKDGFFISWTELNGNMVTHGVLGRVTVIDGDSQRAVFSSLQFSSIDK